MTKHIIALLENLVTEGFETEIKDDQCFKLRGTYQGYPLVICSDHRRQEIWFISRTFPGIAELKYSYERFYLKFC
ncbi:hypothetical protein NIES4102_42240 (plasmid) [Chondrocystis sp. NIES-4102]|nr:hypothetical protein NIES4102_41030 [Chondrocystis sp. NIES-4102]BAZ47178.1 hypothetical protein NIES4102_42240 [Chondrocystis sp. NIES-4102]